MLAILVTEFHRGERWVKYIGSKVAQVGCGSLKFLLQGDRSMTKKTITRWFSLYDSAELFLNKLYQEYDYVRLISSPMFSEAGYYTWEVGNL